MAKNRWEYLLYNYTWALPIFIRPLACAIKLPLHHSRPFHPHIQSLSPISLPYHLARTRNLIGNNMRRTFGHWSIECICRRYRFSLDLIYAVVQSNWKSEDLNGCEFAYRDHVWLTYEIMLCSKSIIRLPKNGAESMQFVHMDHPFIHPNACIHRWVYQNLYLFRFGKTISTRKHWINIKLHTLVRPQLVFFFLRRI